MRPRTAVLVALTLVVLVTALAGCSRDEISGTEHSGIVCDVERPGGTVESSPTYTGEVIPAYSIDVEVHADGSATFTETITYSFFGAKHGIFRELIVRQACTDSADRVYPLEIISVSSTTAPADYSVDQPSPPGLNASDMINVMVNGSPIRRLRIGDADRTITGTHTYEIVYRLDGVVNEPAEDGAGQADLYWNVIGDGWGVDMFGITSSVRAPDAVTSAECWAGPVGSTTPCTSAQVVDGTAQFTQESLGPRQALTVRAAFPATAGGPLFDDRWSVAGALWSAPWIPVLALVLTVLAILGWFFLAHRVGRDRQAVGLPVDVAFASEAGQVARVPLWGNRDQVIPVEYVPPGGIRPGQVGLLVDETADAEDITATIVDLAVRGYVRIDETETKSGWLGSTTDYTITRLSPEPPKPLLGYEQLLLDKLVPIPGSSRSLSSLKDTFAGDYAKVVDALYDDAMQRGWFHARPDQVRTRWRAHGVLFLLAGIAAFVACFFFTRFALLTIPIMVWGLLTMIGAGRMPRRTAEGRGATLRARGFETFIRDSEAPRAQWAENNNIFSDYLPYAIVLGCVDRWANTFSFLGDEARGDTDWYHSAHHGFAASSIVSSMSNFSSSASSSLTSSPSSSGDGGGGGSSGGGGGGGGGGSW